MDVQGAQWFEECAVAVVEAALSQGLGLGGGGTVRDWIGLSESTMT